MPTELERTQPYLPTTPTSTLPGDVREVVKMGARSFVVHRPAESEKLLDHPAIHQAFSDDEFLPYWVDIWPSARMLVDALGRESLPERETPLRALEMGCGLGVAGLAALARGFRVTFSDYDATALEYAARNARANGFTEFDTLQMDWRHPPTEKTYPLLFGADLIYEARNVEPVVSLIQALLEPGGVCLLTDQNRVHAETLVATLRERGVPFTTEAIVDEPPEGPRVEGTVYRIRNAEFGMRNPNNTER